MEKLSNSERDWLPEDLAYGSIYWCTCRKCNENFFGVKYRRICKVCQIKENESNKPNPSNEFRFL